MINLCDEATGIENWYTLGLFAGRIEQANVSFHDGTGRPFLGSGSQEPGDPARQGKSQGEETRAA